MAVTVPTQDQSATSVAQPLRCLPHKELVEPDWRRLPGYRDVSRTEWENALWQRRHTVTSLTQLKKAMGDALPTTLLESIRQDQGAQATMPILVTPQMLNCMDDRDLWADPIRRYVLPAARDRHQRWPNHPRASRDSLHETDMWVVEGLTHRYPTKVLAELLSTCPLYCGHCTRMDLVGKDVAKVIKTRFESSTKVRYAEILEYLERTPSVRDVVVSGGDVTNLPISVLEDFVSRILDIPTVRNIRLAAKGLVVLPQHFMQREVLCGLERLATKARTRGVDLALHTHVNHASQLTPLVAQATERLLDMGFRDVRNQGVLLRGVNSTAQAILDLSVGLLDQAHIMPYYMYMCDIVPHCEHWRLSLTEAQALQDAVTGYLPGFALPRFTVDVALVGKRSVFQARRYDRETGVSWWTKNYRTPFEGDDAAALSRQHPYYDPVYTLPKAGQEYWRQRSAAT